MAISIIYTDKINKLRREFELCRHGKEDLLKKIEEAELPENVYNSNAIENSTLTLKETEKILLEAEISRDLNLREVFEAKNLAQVTEFVRIKPLTADVSKDIMCHLHKMLLLNIDSDIAGRFREGGEYVRIGTYIAPPPEHVEHLVDELIVEYNSDESTHIVDKIARFHLEFEKIHPFVDGNGRIGRVLINYQLIQAGLPPLIIRSRGKEKNYYSAFPEYIDDRKTKRMSKLLALNLAESLHKRIAYMKGLEVLRLSEHAKDSEQTTQTLLNAARRQTIPAFREKNVWKIGI